MPDLFFVFEKRWKFIITLTILAALVSFIVCLVVPKQFLSVATALPSNSVVADKARLFNSNIEQLYSELGSPDELDRIVGTAKLDTIYISAVNQLRLIDHYGFEPSSEGLYDAVRILKKNSRINTSAYGELKVKVWDVNRERSAEIANTLMQNIQELHGRLHNEANASILYSLKQDYQQKLQDFRQTSDTIKNLSGSDAEIWTVRKEGLMEQLQQYQTMISQFQLAVNSPHKVLMVVENARPSFRYDKPNTATTVLLCAFATFVFAFLMSLIFEGRKSSK